MPRFASIKRKLTFEEDFVSTTSDNKYTLPLDAVNISDKNPFIKLLDSAESVPTFNYAYTYGRDFDLTPNGKMSLTGGKSKSRKQAFLSA